MCFKLKYQDIYQTSTKYVLKKGLSFVIDHLGIGYIQPFFGLSEISTFFHTKLDCEIWRIWRTSLSVQGITP